MVSLTCGDYSQNIGSLFNHSITSAEEETPDAGRVKRPKVAVDTPPKALPCPPKQLALADAIGHGVPKTPPAVPASEVDLTAGSPGSVISDGQGDEP